MYSIKIGYIQSLCYSHGTITESCFEYFMRLKQKLTQLRSSSAPSTIKSWIAFNRYVTDPRSQVRQRVMAAYLSSQTQKIDIV